MAASKRSRAEVNLWGSEFVLDNIDITALLSPNMPFTINDRDVTLSGLLADGSAFSFDLTSTFGMSDYFDAGATLTIMLMSLFPPGDSTATATWTQMTTPSGERLLGPRQILRQMATEIMSSTLPTMSYGGKTWERGRLPSAGVYRTSPNRPLGN